MSSAPIAVEEYGWRSTQEPYHWSYLAPTILRLVKDLHIDRVMDLGCGNGKLCGLLAERCSLVVGVEYDKRGAEISAAANPNLRIFNLGVQDDPQVIAEEFPEGFDAVLSTEVIEHLYLPRLLPRFAHPLMRGGGVHCRQHALPRLSEESMPRSFRRMGSPSHRTPRRWPHQVLEP